MLLSFVRRRAAIGPVLFISALALSCGLQPLSAKPQTPSLLQLDSQFSAHQLTGESLIQVLDGPDGGLFATAASDGTLKVWNADTTLQQQYVQPTRAMLFNARWNPDAQSLLTAPYNGVATLWSRGQSKPVRQFGPHLSGVTDVEFLTEDGGVVTSSDDGSIRFWSKTGVLLQRVERPGVTRHLAQARSRRVIAATQDIGAVTLMDTKGTPVQVIQTSQGRLNDVVFSPDEQIMLTGGFDGSIKVWDVSDLSRSVVLIKAIPAVPGSGWLESLAINRDGIIASAADDGVVRIWSMDGNELASMKLSDHHLMSLSFSPDGRRLLAAAQDGTVSVLRVTQPR
jgi:WD40 repeat protein